MSTATTGLLTAEEYWEWRTRPENQDRCCELEDGVIVDMPSPGLLHGVVCGLVAYLLMQYVIQRRKGYVCTNDTGLLVARKPDSVRGPDVMMFDEAVRFEELSPKFAETVPALIVEVQSPSDKIAKTNRRISQYLRRGVRLVWLVDPDTRTVTVYRPGQIHQVADDTEELAGDLAPAGFRCRVVDFFTLPDQGDVRTLEAQHGEQPAGGKPPSPRGRRPDPGAPGGGLSTEQAGGRRRKRRGPAG